jgi:predicted MFS family arabinose efflux permease
VGGALLVPNSLALISAAYPSDQRGKAIGTWAGASALTTALGPILGGVLVDAFSWRWVYFVVVPLALAALAIARWRVPESRTGSTAPLDWPGAALGTAALGALCYGLIASSERGWTSVPVVVALAGAVLLMAGFLLREARARDPMMPLSLFRSATFSGANAMTLLLYAALGGALFFLPFELVQVRGYTATEAGAALLPLSVLLGGLSRQAGGVLDRFGARAPLTVGPLVAALGLALLAWLAGSPDASGYWTTVFPGLTVLGLGLTVSVAPLTTTVLNAVPAGSEGVASGVNNAAARVAGLLAVAALGAVAIGVFGRALDARLASLDVAPELRAELLAQSRDLAALRVPAEVPGALAAELERAIDGAFTAAFRWTTALTAALALCGGVCAAATIRPRVE